MKRFCQRVGGRRRGGWLDAGQSLVEFALAATVFLVLTFGILEFGRAIYQYNIVSTAAREAVRWAIVRGEDGAMTASTTDVQNFVAARTMGLPVTTTVSWAPDKKPGSVVTVQVQANFMSVIPMLPVGSLPLTSTHQMVISR